MQNAIIANNPGVTPQAGFIYMLAGPVGGTTGGVSTTPELGNSRTALDSSIFKVTVSPQGNIYIGDSSKVLFYDMTSGYIRILFTGSSNATTGNFCTGSSGQKSLSAYSDGCPANNSLFTNATAWVSRRTVRIISISTTPPAMAAACWSQSAGAGLRPRKRLALPDPELCRFTFRRHPPEPCLLHPRHLPLRPT